MPKLTSSIKEFFQANGEYSSGRLIFIIGSLIVFGIYIYDHKDSGVQNIMIAVLGYSSASITLSKFSNNKTDETK